MRMKPVEKKKATGVLASMLANINEENLLKTRNRMRLAVKIGDAMKSKGLTQKEFARLVGKTESEVSDWLSGDRNFTVDTLTVIEHALGVNLLNTSIYKFSFVQRPEEDCGNVFSLHYSKEREYSFAQKCVG